MDELDRILETEPALEPSSGLSSSIMNAVLREALTPPPLRFPWIRLALGMGVAAAAVVSVVVAVWAGAIGGDKVTPVPWEWRELMAQPSVAALGWTAVALLVSYASWAFSRRLAR